MDTIPPFQPQRICIAHNWTHIALRTFTCSICTGSIVVPDMLFKIIAKDGQITTLTEQSDVVAIKLWNLAFKELRRYLVTDDRLAETCSGFVLEFNGFDLTATLNVAKVHPFYKMLHNYARNSRVRASGSDTGVLMYEYYYPTPKKYSNPSAPEMILLFGLLFGLLSVVYVLTQEY